MVISTKAGRVILPKSECSPDNKWVAWENEQEFLRDGSKPDVVPVYDYSAAGVRKSYEQSMERLRGLPITTLRLHDAETPERYEWAIKEGAVDELVKLRSEGKIKYVSLGMNKTEYLLKVSVCVCWCVGVLCLSREPKGKYKERRNKKEFIRVC